MKKQLYLLICALGITSAALAQNIPLMPNVNIGVKAGVNLSNFSTNRTLNNDNQAGYLAGVWARIGLGGLHFQPELYYTAKNVKLNDTYYGTRNTAKFRSIDMPLLVGKRFGMLGVGARINTGPLVSFSVNHDQSVGDAFSNASRVRVKDQNYAWVFGAGLDVYKVSLDLRYEAGINKLQNGNGNSDIRVNMFNLTLAYRLFSM